MGGHADGRHGAGHHGAGRPPVTEQEDWESVLLPWIREVQDGLGIADSVIDVDRVHAMTGVVAGEVQRSMAPISSFLVGLAMGRGAELEDACAAVERITLAPSRASAGADEQATGRQDEQPAGRPDEQHAGLRKADRVR